MRLLPLLLLWLLLPEVALAQVRLQAPDTVRDLLLRYIELPANLADETARASFVRHMRQEMGELLATEGYFSPQLNLLAGGEIGDWILQVEPGKQTQVTELHLVFNGDLAQQSARQAALKTAWLLPESAPFRSVVWEQAKDQLLSSVTQQAYLAAAITYSQADVNPDSARAKLTLVLDSGPVFHFGALQIQGLQRYDPQLIHRVATFQVGDIYQRDKLLSFQNHLQNMPQFSSVSVQMDSDVEHSQAAAVKVLLEEAQTQRMALGLGYSTNNGARGEINYRSHNFWQRAWNLSTSLRLEQYKQLLSFDVDTMPDQRGYVLSWGAGSEASTIAGLSTLRNKFSLTRSRTRGTMERSLGLNWQQENRRPLDGIAENNQALVLDAQWHKRDVDNALNPQQGYVTELRLGGATQALLSDQNFVRSYARQQNWWQLTPHDVLSARAEAGLTLAPSRLGIPQEYLFRAGGAQSVRGYRYQSIGFHEGSAVVGARFLSTASVEYTHWFGRNWGAAVFLDVGGAADNWRDLPWQVGYGAGARWRSPVGPLALDVAWGNDPKQVQLHFSIAVAF